MKLDCKRVDELLVEYLYDELEPGQRALVDAHLGSCSACAERAGSLSGTRSLMAELPELSPSRDDSYVLKVASEQARRRRKQEGLLGRLSRLGRWLGERPSMVALPVAAAVVLVVVGVNVKDELSTFFSASADALAGSESELPWEPTLQKAIPERHHRFEEEAEEKAANELEPRPPSKRQDPESEAPFERQDPEPQAPFERQEPKGRASRAREPNAAVAGRPAQSLPRATRRASPPPRAAEGRDSRDDAPASEVGGMPAEEPAGGSVDEMQEAGSETDPGSAASSRPAAPARSARGRSSSSARRTPHAFEGERVGEVSRAPAREENAKGAEPVPQESAAPESASPPSDRPSPPVEDAEGAEPVPHQSALPEPASTSSDRSSPPVEDAEGAEPSSRSAPSAPSSSAAVHDELDSAERGADMEQEEVVSARSESRGFSLFRRQRSRRAQEQAAATPTALEAARRMAAEGRCEELLRHLDSFHSNRPESMAEAQVLRARC
ncbi:MAG: zf-HC2 domain-containing protein, partial [Myxococcota bacterium]